MEDIERLKTILEPVLCDLGIKLYDLTWVQNGREHTLQVSIMRQDGTMDLDTCALVSEKLSVRLDQEDPFENSYTLEVCSPGAERVITDLDELKKLPYVHVRLKHAVAKGNTFTGQVDAYENHMITLSYRDKAAVRSIRFADAEIELIRYAVKL